METDVVSDGNLAASVQMINDVLGGGGYGPNKKLQAMNNKKGEDKAVGIVTEQRATGTVPTNIFNGILKLITK